MPYLVLEHLEKETRWTVSINDDSFVIGRSRNAAVCIRDLSVSKKHVRVDRRSGRYRFLDLGSKNGTYINDFRRSRGPLHDGDELRVGKIRITFYKECRSLDEISTPTPRTAEQTNGEHPGKPEGPAAPLKMPENAAAGQPESGSGEPPIFGEDTLLVDAEHAESGAKQPALQDDLPAAGSRQPDADDELPVLELVELPDDAPATDSKPPVAERAEDRRSPENDQGAGSGVSVKRGRSPTPGRSPRPPRTVPRVVRRGRGRAVGRRQRSRTGAVSPDRADWEISPSELDDRATSTWRWSTAALLLASFICLLAGFLLGRLSVGSPKKLEEEQSKPASPMVERQSDLSPSADEETVDATALLNESERVARAPPPELGPGTGERTDDSSPASLHLILGTRADLADPETSRRALVRLFLDVLKRPPTRGDVRELLPLSHDERWQRVQGLASAGQEAPVKDSVADATRRFLGRPASASESERLLAAVGGDPSRLGALLASSRLYASPDHRRERSEIQLARSLWVDLLDLVPTDENTAAVRQELANEDFVLVVRTLLFSARGEATQPKSGEDLGSWCRELYARVLLRFPAQQELETAIAVVEGGAEGWKTVTQELVSREEYRQY